MIEGFYVEEAGVPIVWPSADTLVWLDLPRRVCVPRAVRRSFDQVVRRVELWNGNRQRASVLTPRSIWGLWRRWPSYPATIERALDAHDWSHLDVVRLRNADEVRRFLADRSVVGRLPSSPSTVEQRGHRSARHEEVPPLRSPVMSRWVDEPWGVQEYRAIDRFTIAGRGALR